MCRAAPLCVLLLAGCVTTTRPLDVTDAASRRAVSERAGRQPAFVTVRGERAAEARGLRVDADSTSWVDEAGALRVVPTADLERVAFPGADPRGRLGRTEGFVLGFAAGTLGTALAYTADDFSVGHSAVAVVLLGLPVGVAVGGVGAAVANGQPEGFVAAPPRPPAGR